jgi:hypothetical protein
MMTVQNEKLQNFFLFAPFLLPAFVGSFCALTCRYGPQGTLMLLLSFVGAGLVVFSKIRLKNRTKKLLEWGTKGMARNETICYFLGYILIAVSLILVVI